MAAHASTKRCLIDANWGTFRFAFHSRSTARRLVEQLVAMAANARHVEFVKRGMCRIPVSTDPLGAAAGPNNLARQRRNVQNSTGVVERREMDRLFQELRLGQHPDRANEATRLRLGQLTTADFVLLALLLPPDTKTNNRYVTAQVVEAHRGDPRSDRRADQCGDCRRRGTANRSLPRCCRAGTSPTDRVGEELGRVRALP